MHFAFVFNGERRTLPIQKVGSIIICASRGIALQYAPEEVVRQGILRVIQTELEPQLLATLQIYAEWRSTDIAIHIQREHAAFRPPISPAFIIETKHRGIPIPSTDAPIDQISSYLRRHACAIGAMTNGETVLIVDRESQIIQSGNDCSLLLEHLRRSVIAAQYEYSEGYDWFQQAQYGEGQSLLRLIDLYGNKLLTRFHFEAGQGRFETIRLARNIRYVDGVIHFTSSSTSYAYLLQDLRLKRITTEGDADVL